MSPHDVEAPVGVAALIAPDNAITIMDAAG